MKQCLMMAALGLIMTALTACGPANTPKDAAKTFVNALMKADFATVKQFAAPDELSLIEATEKQTLADFTANPELEKAYKGEFIFVSQEEKDPNTVVINFKLAPDAPLGHIHVKKFDGQWKVSVQHDHGPAAAHDPHDGHDHSGHDHDSHDGHDHAGHSH